MNSRVYSGKLLRKREKMKIFVDADACPVVGIVDGIAYKQIKEIA